MRVSQPGDKHEIEADRSADRVVERLSNPFFRPAVQKDSEQAGDDVATKRSLRREALQQSEASANPEEVTRAPKPDERDAGAEPAIATEPAADSPDSDTPQPSRRPEATEDSREEKEPAQAFREQDEPEPASALRQSEDEHADRQPEQDGDAKRQEEKAQAPGESAGAEELPVERQADEAEPARQADDEAAAMRKEDDESSSMRQQQSPAAAMREEAEDATGSRQEDAAQTSRAAAEPETAQLKGEESEDAVAKREEEPQPSRQVEESEASREQEEEEVQARANGPATVSAEVQHRIHESKGRGAPLPLAVQADFGAAFGRDFSNIRIHTGAEGARLSSDLNAKAFAHGPDIYFNEGQYNPDTKEGQHLLAHELTHTAQTGNAPVSMAPAKGFLAELLEQLKLSRREAKQAEDPRPAAEARKQADAEGKKALVAAGAKKGEVKAEDARPGKASAPEPRVASVKRRAPTTVEPAGDGPAKGEVGQYLDEQSSEVCSKGAAKSQHLADNESAHDPATSKLDQTKAAVKPPEKENQSRKEADQVKSVQTAADPKVTPDANRARLDTAIEEAVPESIEELNEFESEGKGKVVGNAVLGEVQKDVNAVRGSYKKIEDVKPAAAAKTPAPLPAIETAPETSRLNLGKEAVPPLAEEHTDFSEFDQQSDDMLKKEEIKDEHLSMVDSGDLAEANKERQGLKKKVKESPAQAQQFAVQHTARVEKDMQSEESATRKAMEGKRKEGLTATETQQKKTRSALELKRENVTREVNKRFEAVRKSVTTKLDNLERNSLARFDREQKRFSVLFEQDVRRRVDRWKDKRYSGIFAGIKWLKDKIVGIDHFPEVRNAFAVARRAYVRNIDRLIREINADNAKVIEGCKQELKTAKEKVQEFIDGLGPDLRKAGQAAMTDMQSKLKELEGFIDKRKEELQNKLCEKKEKAIEAIDRKIEEMKSEMSGALSKLGKLLLKAMLKFFKWALEKVGLKPQALLDQINKGSSVIKKIVTKPVKFFKNLARAVKTGIGNFVNNIKKHLLNGMMSWLTGQLGEAGITLPSKFDLKGIISLFLQILGLTWTNIRKKLVKRVGERAVAAAEKTVDIVKRVRAEGPIALWHMIKEKAAEIKQKVMEKVRNWIIVQVVKKAVTKLAMMLNPVGAIVQAVIAIYDVVMFFVENIKRIIDFVKSILSSIGKIASGAIGAAASFIESAMAKTVPIILSFLARFFGLSGIGKIVQKTIKSIRKPVDKAVGKGLDFVAKIVRKVTGKAKAVARKVKAKAKKVKDKAKKAAKKAIGKLKKWWLKKTPFKAGGEQHHLFFKASKPTSAIMMASKKQEVKNFLKDNQPSGGESEGELARKYGQAKAQLAKVETARSKLSEEMRKSKKPTKKQQEANEKLMKEWDKLKQRLVDFMDELKGQSTHAKTEISYDGLEHGELGKGATAWPLTIKGDAGSTPKVSNPIWEQVNLRQQGKGGYYIRGHLINDNLHGPGTEPKNLTPISQQANADHKVGVEEKVKDVVWNRLGKSGKDKNAKGQAVMYRVVAVYGKDFRPALGDMKKKIADSTQDDERIGDLTRIVVNEQLLPSKFVCSAEIVGKVNKTTYKKSGVKIPLAAGGVVKNEIPNTVPVLRGEPPRVVVRLSLSRPGASEAEAVKALRVVKGVDEVRAAAIYHARWLNKDGKKLKRGRDFSSYEDLEARAAGIGPSTIAALQGYEFRGKKIVELAGKTVYSK